MGVLKGAELDRPDGRWGAHVFISRQPVLDAHRNIAGYRVAYTSEGGEQELESYAIAESDGGATRLFGDILSVVGLEELVGDTLAHIPVSRPLLLTLDVPPVRPDRVVLRVAYMHAVDPRLRPILEVLASRGYTLSLYDLSGPDIDQGLLELFGIVELPFSREAEAELRWALADIDAARATALAVGVNTNEDFEWAKSLGFSMFSGSFFSSPGVKAVQDVPVLALASLAGLLRMQGMDTTLEQLEQLIDHDLGLSVKLLRYTNSAYFGMRSKITSIRQALMMLGVRGAHRWAMMIALTGASKAPIEVSVMALTRARMCESLAADRPNIAADEMFMIGLLSLADALLEAPLPAVLETLPLADEVVAALLHRAGPVGFILDAVVNYETGNFYNDSVQAHRGEISDAYIEALRWAREVVQGLGADAAASVD